jgi:5-methylthioadenosine/S-adenosylhomocysteine deaminase
MQKLLVKNIDWVVTVDCDRRMIEDGAIAVIGDRIAAVGKSAALETSFGADVVIDGRGLMALPGLVDCSVATVQHLGRGLADRCDIPDYRLQRCLPYEGALSAEDAHSASLACQLEMIRSGTTCFVDSGSRFPEEVAAAAVESGLRAVATRSCCDVYDTFMGAFPDSITQETAAEALNHAQAAIRRIGDAGHARVRPGVAIPWMAACSDHLCRGIAALARSADLPVIATAGFSRDDAVASRREHGKTEIGRLLDTGLLGSHSIVANAGWASPRDMLTLKEQGANVACTPSVSHRLGTGSLEFGRYPELLMFGVNVTFGSGSAMAGNFTDIARQLFLFCGGNISTRLDATIAPPETALEMATIRGAAAIGLESEIGSLEAGKKADIALFDVVATDWVPLINPLANLAFSTRGGAHTVIVDGQLLMSAGKVHSLDEERVLSECQSRAERLAVRGDLARFAALQWGVQ